MSATSPSDALQGLRVVEFGQYIAAPAAAQTLADLGADVVKIEPPAGDAARRVGWARDAFGPMFSAYNRGKRSVLLDLKTPEGQAMAHALVASADVVLQNSRPGVMDKLGLGPAQLLARQPRLVYGQVSGFGQAGPDSQRPCFDIAAQAESGMMSINGPRDGDPTRVGFTVVDLLASQNLATGVLAALVRRGATGRGGLVDVSLIDVAVQALANQWTEYRLTGTLPLRAGNGQLNAAPAAEVIATADGMVVVSAYMDEHFLRLCEVLGRPELARDPRFQRNAGRVEHKPALLVELRQALSSFTTEQVCGMLSRAGVVVGAIHTMDQIAAGQGGVSADLFLQAEAPGRAAIAVPGLPFALDGAARGHGRLPALGEHTEEVLAALR